MPPKFCTKLPRLVPHLCAPVIPRLMLFYPFPPAIHKDFIDKIGQKCAVSHLTLYFVRVSDASGELTFEQIKTGDITADDFQSAVSHRNEVALILRENCSFIFSFSFPLVVILTGGFVLCVQMLKS